ncbi:FMN-linked oxidoreductase [Trichoderma afarasin]
MPAQKIPATSKIFQPLKVGRITLPHRIVMAPLSRYRNSDDHVPLDMAVEYYSDRAAVPGTLIISEATAISQDDETDPNGPGIWSDKEIAQWKRIISAVHARGGYFIQQIWSLGRAGDAQFARSKGIKYASSSKSPMEGSDITPEELTEEEIWVKIDSFAQAAKTAIAAGADGVELHGAHGYLIDQFTRESINKRTDKWGGSVENRARFAIEAVKAVAAAVGADRTAIRLSPWATFQGATSSDPQAQFLYMLREFKRLNLNLGYVHLVEATGDPVTWLHKKEDELGQHKAYRQNTLEYLLEEWDNWSPVIIAGGFNAENVFSAVDNLYSKWDVAVAFGRYFISNPDLVFRLQNGITLSPYKRDSFYAKKSPVGYIDYPVSEEFLDGSWT